MAKITVEIDGNKETIEIEDDAVEKLIGSLVKKIETKYVKKVTKKVKLTKKEERQLISWYNDLIFSEDIECKVIVDIKGFNHYELENLVTSDVISKEALYHNMMRKLNLIPILEDVSEYSEVGDYIDEKEKLLDKFRIKTAELAEKYNTTTTGIWDSIDF